MTSGCNICPTNQNLIYLTGFRQSAAIQNFMKIHRVGAEVLPAGRKDGQTPDDANFYPLFETFFIGAPKKI
jgi:hypothetical protein